MANYPKPQKGSRHNADTHYRSGVRQQLREDRQVQAKIRQAGYSKLSTDEKLSRLDAGHFTATRQRARLAKAVEAATPVVAETPKPKKARKGRRS